MRVTICLADFSVTDDGSTLNESEYPPFETLSSYIITLRSREYDGHRNTDERGTKCKFIRKLRRWDIPLVDRSLGDSQWESSRLDPSQNFPTFRGRFRVRDGHVEMVYATWLQCFGNAKLYRNAQNHTGRRQQSTILLPHQFPTKRKVGNVGNGTKKRWQSYFPPFGISRWWNIHSHALNSEKRSRRPTLDKRRLRRASHGLSNNCE